MILRELYYFDKKTMEPVEDDRYRENDDEISSMNLDDTRKTRLTLRDKKEASDDLLYIRAMYGLAAQRQGETA
jgi:hypothetical protein